MLIRAGSGVAGDRFTISRSGMSKAEGRLAQDHRVVREVSASCVQRAVNQTCTSCYFAGPIFPSEISYSSLYSLFPVRGVESGT